MASTKQRYWRVPATMERREQGCTTIPAITRPMFSIPTVTVSKLFTKAGNTHNHEKTNLSVERPAEESLSKFFDDKFTAQIRKTLIISGAGEGNRTLVIITKAVCCGNALI